MTSTGKAGRVCALSPLCPSAAGGMEPAPSSQLQTASGALPVGHGWPHTLGPAGTSPQSPVSHNQWSWEGVEGKSGGREAEGSGVEGKWQYVTQYSDIGTAHSEGLNRAWLHME